MRIFDGFDEIRSAVGTEIGASEWIEITQDRIDKFAEATCDEQWIHIDQDRAKKELPGGRTIAHGLLSLSLAPMFIRSVMGLKGPHKHRGSGGRPPRWFKIQLSHGDQNRRRPAPRLRRRADRTPLSMRFRA